MCRGNRKRDVTTMVIYSHASTPFSQSERAYYLSYFIICNNTLYFPVGYKSLSEVSRSHNRGRRPQARAISSIGVDPMIWDNFSIFRTNCAIACSTRAYIAARIRMSRKGNGVRNSRNRLWLLEFCLRISAVRCSTLSEDTAEFRYVPLYIADLTFILQSKFHIWGRF